MSDMTHVFENDSERVTNVFSLTFLEERKQRSHTNKTLSPPFLAILAYFPSDILVITVIARNIRNSVGSLFFRKRILRFGNIGIYLPNLGILLSRKNNEPTLLILFRAMTVTMCIPDRPNVSLLHVWRSIKEVFFCKKGNSALSEHTCLTHKTCTQI